MILIKMTPRLDKSDGFNYSVIIQPEMFDIMAVRYFMAHNIRGNEMYEVLIFLKPDGRMELTNLHMRFVILNPDEVMYLGHTIVDLINDRFTGWPENKYLFYESEEAYYERIVSELKGEVRPGEQDSTGSESGDYRKYIIEA